jgi:hypothetical protein
MKPFLVALTLFLLPLLVLAQPVKTQKKRSAYFLEEFEVRADNDTIRQGAYRKSLLMVDKLLEEGQYENNRRVGVWTFFDATGRPELIYNYSTQKIVALVRVQKTPSMTQVVEGDSAVNVTLDDGPVYLASSMQVYSVMAKTVRFPPALQRAGHTEISFKALATVSSSGTIYRPICSLSDKAFAQTSREAVSTAFAGVEWVPARYQQQPVTATYLFDDVVLIGYSVPSR